jgi:uncharacterized membrane protein YeaQ/YmgE (transglycosylase-associated protein family)
MVHIAFWLSFGALVGWVAAILRGEDTSWRSVAYIMAGVIGGLTGGLASVLLSPGNIEFTVQASGITFAIFGAIAFVGLARIADTKRSEH